MRKLPEGEARERKRARDRLRNREAEYERNREKRRAAGYCPLSDDERAERRREWRRRHYEENREFHLKRGKAWRLAHPERQRELMRAWSKRNREKVRARKRASKRARRSEVIAVLMKMQRGKCAYCREPLRVGFHVDHIIPMKLGGSDERSNFQLTCAECNLDKKAKDPVVYARELGMLL